MDESILEFELRQLMDRHGWKRYDDSGDSILLTLLDRTLDQWYAELERTRHG